MGKGDGVGEGVYATTGGWLGWLASVVSMCVPSVFRGCSVAVLCVGEEMTREWWSTRVAATITPHREHEQKTLCEKNNYFSREPTQKINYYFFEKASSSALRKNCFFSGSQVKCSPAALLHNAQMNSGGYITESGLPLFYKKNVFFVACRIHRK